MPQNSAEHRAGAYQMLERLNLRCAAWPAARCGRDFAEVFYNDFGNLLTVGHTGRVNVNDFLGDHDTRATFWTLGPLILV